VDGYTQTLKTENICLCVCLCVFPFFVSRARPQFWADLHESLLVASLYPTDGHGGERASLELPLARSRTIYTPLQMTGEVRREIRNKRNGLSLIESRRRKNRAPLAQGVTERRRREGGALIISKDVKVHSCTTVRQQIYIKNILIAPCSFCF